MKLNRILIATLATGSAIAAQPALAQTSGPASGAVDATAGIFDSQLNLEVVGGQSLLFGELARPTGVVSGAQCRYSLGVTTATLGNPQVRLAEIRNGTVFDGNFPTPSGCEVRDVAAPRAADFSVRCTPATPVTIRTEWQSSGLQGLVLTAETQGVYIRSPTIGGSQFNFNPAVNQVVNCSEGGANPSVDSFAVHVGGTLTVDADAAVGPNVLVGTVTLNATY
jgi:hypothetical protein